MRLSSALSYKQLMSLCLLLLLVACQPAGQRPTAPEMDTISELQRTAAIHYAQQEFSAAASRYNQLQRLDPANRERWALRATDAWIQAGDLNQARLNLQQLNTQELSNSQLAYLQLLRTELALAATDFYAARQLSAELDALSDALSDRLQPRYLDIQQRLLEQSSGKTRAVLTQVQTSDSDAQRFAAFQQLVRQPANELRQLYASKSSLQDSTWLAAALAARQQAIARQFEVHTPSDTVSAGQRLDRLTAQQQTFIQQFLAQADYPASIAILLPEQGPLAAAGNAIRKGIVSGWLQLPPNQRPELHFIDAGDTPAAATGAMYTAIEKGASWVIGPLQRESVSAVINMPGRNLPLLVLNQPAGQHKAAPAQSNGLDGQPDQLKPQASLQSPPVQQDTSNRYLNEYVFALLPEDEARATANAMYADGHQVVATLAPDDEQGKRLVDTFNEQFSALGGTVAANRLYTSNQIEFSALINDGMNTGASVQRHARLQSLLDEELGFRQRTSVDAVFLAGTAQQARLILPQLKYQDLDYVPVYASERVFSKPDDIARNRDLNRLQFTSPGWLYGAQPDPRVDTVNRWDKSLDNLLFNKLFALGRDSLLLTPYLELLRGDDQLQLQAASGHLQVTQDGMVQRTLQRVRYRDGQPVLARRQ